MVHKPSGLDVRIESERSQHHNLRVAKSILHDKLTDRTRSRAKQTRNSTRKDQVGSGMRGDKRRTIRVQADQVVDHITGATMTVQRYLRGELDRLVR